MKPLITPAQKKKRLLFCHANKNKTKEEWEKYLWSDESTFQVSYGNNKGRVMRKSNEAFNEHCIRASVKYPAKLMLWGCMSVNGVGHPLYYCEGNVNAIVYQKILKESMIPAANNLFSHVPNGDFIFQQDGARPHTAKSTIKWFDENNVKTFDWPPNSPDLNPIENLWRIMKREVMKIKPRSKLQLKEVLQEVWKKITPEMCQKLIYSMPDRIKAVIKANGGPTKY